VAYDSNRMRLSRRSALLSVAASMVQSPQQQLPPGEKPEQDESNEKLPNGKSRRDAIAANDHKQALKDANELVTLANEIKTELEKAGDFVVPLGTLKKTEEVEKLAKRIRGRLKN
jgi:hypothetical protein